MLSKSRYRAFYVQSNNSNNRLNRLLLGQAVVNNQMKTAKQTDWKTEPLPSKRTTITLNRRLSSTDMRKIRTGLVPEQMEDKWFIFWAHDTLHFHRSWTGHCIYVARFVKDGDVCVMIEVDVNRDPTQWTETSDERDAEMISYLVDLLLLHQHAVMPSDDLSKEKRVIREWSLVGRAMFGQHPYTRGTDVEAVAIKAARMINLIDRAPKFKGTAFRGIRLVEKDAATMELANKTFPGLIMFVRDANLPGTIASNYKKGLIIRERGISDASVRVGGIITSHRYMILSNHMRNLRPIEHGTNWGLCVAPANAHFKVLDIYNYGNKTQILLLHLPEDGDWKLFQNAVFSLEGDLIKTARGSFENNCNEAPIPELATEKWLARCAHPLGMDENGNFFELE